MDSTARPRPNDAHRTAARLAAVASTLTLLLAVLACVAGPSSAAAEPGAAAPEGTPVAWGRASVPTGLSQATAIAAGYRHSLALRPDGTVAAWGDIPSDNLTPPSGLTDATAIAAGVDHSLALTSDGTVVGWGYNSDGQADPPSDLTGVTAIAAGGYHSLALKSDGTVAAWGWADLGQIQVPTGLTDVTAIAAGVAHSLALKSDGTVVGWGFNGMAQTTVPAGLSDVVAIAAGGYHSLALKSDGTVVAWGYSIDQQTAVPDGLTDVTAIAGGFAHSLALKSDGTVVGWGNDGDDQATPPPGLRGVVAIAAGGTSSLALTVPVTFTAATPSAGRYGKEYAGYQFAATAADGSTPTFAVAGDSTLPDGLDLAADGTLSGTPTDADDHTFSVVATAADGTSARTVVKMTIKAKVLRITAHDVAKTVPDADPDLTYAVSPLVTGDEISTVPTCSVPRTHTRPGTYAIVCSGADAGPNYAPVYERGTLTVTRAPTALALAQADGSTLSATLTRSDDQTPVAGRTVRFRDVGTGKVRVLCTATTGTDGVATCTASATPRKTLSARFPGDGAYQPATDPTL